jgi:hypothetical protein
MEEAGEGGDDGSGGALAGAADGGGEPAGATDGGEGGGGEGAPTAEAPAVDWEKMTDEEYFKDFKPPEGVDAKELQANYGAFLRENRIPQSALSKFLEISAGIEKKAAEEESAAAEKAEAEAKAAFQAEGKALREAFNKEQIASAVEVLKGFADDKAFFEAATGRFSNNATLVKLLVNWAETHRSDDVPGAAAGNGGGQDSFLRNWTGVSR